MEINFNVHGPQRKKLVEHIAEYTQQRAEYQYTPTYAYQIGKYTVNKDGNLLSPDEIPAELVTYLKQQGFTSSETVRLNITYRRNEFTDQEVTFDWFTEVNTDDAPAYQQLIDKLVRYAKSHQRIMSTPRDESNEKYAFRCFLLRLGFIGSEYKAQRKVLLRNLTGSAAFKNQEA